ncbi:hypothetical protein A2U01_0068936, partial [Trifolium medium]|nr:hypothetical protein [Trifolium medium]
MNKQTYLLESLEHEDDDLQLIEEFWEDQDEEQEGQQREREMREKGQNENM